VDARLHHLQGKAKLVTAAELLDFMTAVYRDKLAIRNRHVAAARFVSDYNVNNTYQYVINRDDMHVRWLHDAIVDLGGTPEDQPVPDLGAGKDTDAQQRMLAADRDGARDFVARWRERVEALPNARHRSMLRVILGETMEQERFFEQGLAGREDLLGRRADGAGTGDGVLPTRWVG
jgi:bacterioferritin (cytochrome b1)